MAVDETRVHEVNAIVSRARNLADAQVEVRAMVVVGSYAYGQPRMDSDLDIVMAVADRNTWLAEDRWAAQLLGRPLQLIREEDWGPLRERRFQTASGFEVEFGLVTGEWFATPVDPGTARVLTDGCRVVGDREGLVREALRWLALPTITWTSALATLSGETPGDE